MSFFSRLFGYKDKREPFVEEAPPENDMRWLLEEAKRQNKEAANMLAQVADRQVQDAQLIRQVIHDILDRTDKKKVKPIRERPAR